ncbi:MAG: site-2 protease family protein [Candidatus Micrarchaeota archaeon]
MIVLLLIVMAAAALFYVILQLEVPGLWKFFLGVIEMIIVGQIFIRKYKMPNEMGLIMLRSKMGLEAINRLARKQKFWEFFTDAGNGMAYGLSSIFLMRKNMNWDSMVAGLLTLAFLWTFVMPTAMVFLSQLFGTGMVDKVGETGVDLTSAQIILTAILLFGGLFLMLVLSIISYGGYVLSAVVLSFLDGAGIPPDVEPGGTLLLPGVNLPFVEGVLALLIILIVHEGAHAILSRIGKIPVLSSGIVLFGIIPIGAFVEPDEKKLAKLEKVKQTRVLIAGSTSNLATSCIFFFLFMGVLFATDALGLLDIAILGDLSRFLVITFGLAFSLNFIIGTVNLLPLPFFDGYRVLELNMRNKKLVKAIMIITLISFILNFLPWFFAP